MKNHLYVLQIHIRHSTILLIYRCSGYRCYLTKTNNITLRVAKDEESNEFHHREQEIETITLLWMQGERDAQMSWGEVYARSLQGLYHQRKSNNAINRCFLRQQKRDKVKSTFLILSLAKNLSFTKRGS